MPERMPDAPDPVIERVAAELLRHAAPGADFDARVMAGVRRSPPSAVVSAWSWLREPRTVAVSPLGGLALAAGLAALVVGTWLWGPGVRSPSSPSSSLASASSQPLASGSVTFVLLAPRARTVAVSPLSGLAMAASLVLVMGAGFWVAGFRGLQGIAVATPETRNPAPRTLSFVFLAPNASTVSIVGDFNEWDPARTPLTRAASGGLWTVEMPLAPGRYTYSFVVDGRTFVADPVAPRAVGDDFGTPTSVVTVGATSAGGSL